jgi:hypothetical protein
MELKPYEFRDPGALLRDLARQATLDSGAAFLLLVEHPSTEQRLRRVDRLRTPAEITDDEAACDEMRDVIASYDLPDTYPIAFAAMLVLLRPGLCVTSEGEKQWHRAWRYVNHCRPLYSGDLMVVTEHGWWDTMSNLGDVQPCLADAAGPGRREGRLSGERRPSRVVVTPQWP